MAFKVFEDVATLKMFGTLSFLYCDGVDSGDLYAGGNERSFTARTK